MWRVAYITQLGMLVPVPALDGLHSGRAMTYVHVGVLAVDDLVPGVVAWKHRASARNATSLEAGQRLPPAAGNCTVSGARTPGLRVVELRHDW